MFNGTGIRQMSYLPGSDCERKPLEVANESILNRLFDKDGTTDVTSTKRQTRRSWFKRTNDSQETEEFSNKDQIIGLYSNNELNNQSLRKSLRLSLPRSTVSLHQATQVTASNNNSLELYKKLAAEKKEPVYHSLFVAFHERVVMFQHVPMNIGVTAILSQACGGPLEKIKILEETNGVSNSSTYTIELYYRDADAAIEFNEYAKTGRFIVNGLTLFPTLDRPYKHYNTEKVMESQELVIAMVEKKIRRCVVLKSATNKDPPLQANQSNEFYDQIRRIFTRYGTILSIMPQISKHQSISIQYSNVRYAIAAKQSFDSGSAEFMGMQKFWKLKYGHDPVDRNVPASLS